MRKKRCHAETRSSQRDEENSLRTLRLCVTLFKNQRKKGIGDPTQSPNLKLLAHVAATDLDFELPGVVGRECIAMHP